jgi:hypothetical protein
MKEEVEEERRRRRRRRKIKIKRSYKMIKKMFTRKL